MGKRLDGWGFYFCGHQDELKASGRDPETGQRDRMAEHKQDSSEAAISPAEQTQQAAQWGDGPNTRVPMAEAIAAKFRRNGYCFVPLVCEDFSLLCSLDILFLRRDFPLGIISAGDLITG